MTQEKAEQYSEAMMSLASQARSVVRDLNPKVFNLFHLHLFYILYRMN